MSKTTSAAPPSNPDRRRVDRATFDGIVDTKGTNAYHRDPNNSQNPIQANSENTPAKPSDANKSTTLRAMDIYDPRMDPNRYQPPEKSKPSPTPRPVPDRVVPDYKPNPKRTHYRYFDDYGREVSEDEYLKGLSDGRITTKPVLDTVNVSAPVPEKPVAKIPATPPTLVKPALLSYSSSNTVPLPAAVEPVLLPFLASNTVPLSDAVEKPVSMPPLASSAVPLPAVENRQRKTSVHKEIQTLPQIIVASPPLQQDPQPALKRKRSVHKGVQTAGEAKNANASANEFPLQQAALEVRSGQDKQNRKQPVSTKSKKSSRPTTKAPPKLPGAPESDDEDVKNEFYNWVSNSRSDDLGQGRAMEILFRKELKSGLVPNTPRAFMQETKF